jgi:hypothetical protein
MEQLRRRKYKLKNHRTLEVEQLRKRRYNQRYHRTLKEGVKKKKTQKEFRKGKGGGYSNTKRKEMQDITSRNRTTN